MPRLALTAAAVVFSIFLPSRCGSTWFQIPGAPVSATNRFEDIFFLDENLGWVIFFHGELHRTLDGGESWLHYDPSFTYLRSITFVSPTRGFMGTFDEAHPLLETNDGGATWQDVSLPASPVLVGVCGLWTVSPSVIYGCGVYFGFPRVVKTTDGGATWQVFDLSSVAGSLVACYFTSPLEGFVAGGFGAFPESRALVLHTDDGGVTWSERYRGPRTREWCWKISFPSASVGYVSLEKQYSGAAHVLKTVDRGQSWTDLDFPDENEQGVGFVTNEIGWIGGVDNPTYITTDGGLSWEVDGFGLNINRFQFLNESLGYAVGKSVYKYAAPLSVESLATRDRALLESVPNPFSLRTAFTFELPKPVAARLTIFTPGGREIIRLVDEPLAPGRHVRSWDGRDARGQEMPGGVYFYRLDAGDRTLVRKTLLLR
jgi:photosystem II stability/assembly factor-like uncharacterized protein